MQYKHASFIHNTHAWYIHIHNLRNKTSLHSYTINVIYSLTGQISLQSVAFSRGVV